MAVTTPFHVTAEMTSSFRNKFLNGEMQVGTFVKTPSPQIVEVLAVAGFDFVVIDEEHAPFERSAIDIALLAAHAAGMPALVRTSDARSSRLLACLDDGAAGVIVPHVDSAEAATALVRACRYRAGRGFSASTRAGGYGSHAMWNHVDPADDQVTTIAMIEDPTNVTNAEKILAVEGLDGIMVGRADLSVAMGDRSPTHDGANRATYSMIASAETAGKPISLFVGSAEEATLFKQVGVNTFILSSDQALMKESGMNALAAMRQLP